MIFAGSSGFFSVVVYSKYSPNCFGSVGIVLGVVRLVSVGVSYVVFRGCFGSVFGGFKHRWPLGYGLDH